MKVKNELELGWSRVGRKSFSTAIFITLAPTFSWNAVAMSAVLSSSSLESEQHEDAGYSRWAWNSISLQKYPSRVQLNKSQNDKSFGKGGNEEGSVW